jgi:hypothetical protein
MKLSNKQLRVAWRKLKRRSREGVWLHPMVPVRDWVIGVMVAALIIIVTAVWSVSVYTAYRTTNPNTITVEPVTVAYQASVVEAALEAQAERANEFAALQASPIQLFTPSATGTDTSADTAATSTVATTTTATTDAQPPLDNDLTSTSSISNTLNTTDMADSPAPVEPADDTEPEEDDFEPARAISF